MVTRVFPLVSLPGRTWRDQHERRLMAQGGGKLKHFVWVKSLDTVLGENTMSP